MKKQTYNSQELGLISMSYLKGLFPKPKSGELLIDDGDKKGGFTFYYDETYYTKYSESIQRAYQSGSFARSNSEKEWINLLNKVTAAVSSESVDTSNLKTYWLTEE
jgi:hypothetical protein